ncbi:MAG: hypothetical protein ABIA67_06460 [Candidatus Margulisiibacteriota bacterium]
MVIIILDKGSFPGVRSSSQAQPDLRKTVPVLPTRLTDFLRFVAPKITRYIGAEQQGQWNSCGAVSDGLMIEAFKFFPGVEVVSVKVATIIEPANRNLDLRRELKKVRDLLWQVADKNEQRFILLWDILFDRFCLNDGPTISMVELLAEDAPSPEIRDKLVQTITSDFPSLVEQDVLEVFRLIEEGAVNCHLLVNFLTEPQTGFWHRGIVIKLPEGDFFVDGTAVQVNSTDYDPFAERYEFDLLARKGYLILPSKPEFVTQIDYPDILGEY